MEKRLRFDIGSNMYSKNATKLHFTYYYFHKDFFHFGTAEFFKKSPTDYIRCKTTMDFHQDGMLKLGQSLSPVDAQLILLPKQRFFGSLLLSSKRKQKFFKNSNLIERVASVN